VTKTNSENSNDDQPLKAEGETAASKLNLSKRYALLSISVLAVILIWSALWFVAAGRYEAGVKDFLQKAEARQLSIGCETMSVAGYPFRFEISCSKPSVTSEGRSFQADSLKTVSPVWQPRFAIIEVYGPLTISDAGTEIATLTTESLRASIRMQKDDLERLSIEAVKPALEASQPSGQTSPLTAENIQWHVRPSPLSEGDHAYDVLVSAQALMHPDLPDRLSPFTASLSATLENAETVRSWILKPVSNENMAGGMTISALQMNARTDAIKTRLTGAFSTNEAGILNGRGTLLLSGLQDILDIAGQNENLGALSALGLAAMAARPAELEGQAALAIDGTISDGLLRIGSIPIATIPAFN
jgi:hypothetical protein